MILGACMLPLFAALTRPPNFDVLARRLASQQAQSARVTVVLIDCLVPRQRLELQFGPPVSTGLIRARERGDIIAVVGGNRRDGTVLRRGVEARIESLSKYRASNGFFASHAMSAEGGGGQVQGYQAVDASLVAGRRLEIVESEWDSDWPPGKPIFSATARWLQEDPMPVAEAILLSEQLEPLVNEWVELVRDGKRERSTGQMAGVLADLGPFCEVESVDDRAFWVAGLLNPLPALGVAVEIRPIMLQATDSLYRVKLAHMGLTNSIERMKRMPPGPFEVSVPTDL